MQLQYGSQRTWSGIERVTLTKDQILLMLVEDSEIRERGETPLSFRTVLQHFQKQFR